MTFLFGEDDTKGRERRTRRRKSPSIKKVEFNIKHANHIYIFDESFK
jgi:hypothetical protein